MINEQKMLETMHELGFQERLAGTEAVRAGVVMVEGCRHIAMTKELYPAIAAAGGRSNWQAIERNMRHAIEAAQYAAPEAWARFMGPCKANNGEVLHRIAMRCRE